MYSNGKIDEIVNTTNNDVYTGSTCVALSSQIAVHRTCGINLSEKQSMMPLSNCMREHGIERFCIKLVEMFPRSTCEELRARAGYYIKQLGTLNQKVETRTDKAYYTDTSEQFKQYRVENKKN